MNKPFVFVHITDVHLRGRSVDNSFINFRHFLEDVLPSLNADLVVNTGDITNSVSQDPTRSGLLSPSLCRDPAFR